MTIELIQGIKDEVHKCAGLLRVRSFPGELPCLCVKVYIAPQAVGECCNVEGTKRVRIHLGEGTKSEAPTHVGAGEHNVSIFRTES